MIRVARAAHCDAVHPGYGFLSENAVFARRCAEEGLVFVGPSPAVLELFGDKTRARSHAAECGVPVLQGTQGPTSLAQLKAFHESLGAGAAMIIKAVAAAAGAACGWSSALEQIDAAYERCTSEAAAAFGDGAVYAERLMARARHVEIQVIGDGSGAVSQLGERDCTLQRRHQKLVEISPSPGLPPATRERLLAAALAWHGKSATAAWAPSSSWSMSTMASALRSSKSTRGCRSNTR